MVAISRSNPIYGAQGQPHYITNAYYQPQGYFATANSLTTTINRCYYVPFSVWEAHTFQGAATFNSGTGDNGEHIRMMVFNDNGANGGPGTLAKDFGEITLSGAAAQRTLASTWAALPGMYWSAIWHETAAAMISMDPLSFATTAGGYAGPKPNDFMGTLSYTASAGAVAAVHYVDTAYGVAPATAVAPTASLNMAWGNVGNNPIFSLKA